MWILSKYILISAFLTLNIIYIDFNYFKFGVLSELLWLFLYTFISVSGAYVNDPGLLSLPFFILTLTAVEAVVFWSLLLWNINK